MLRTRDYIKNCFNQGDKPTEQNFGDLFDSVYWQTDVISNALHSNNSDSIGNWQVDENGNLQNFVDDAGIAMANWSIDANGYFSGTAGAANLLKRSPLEFVNKWYLDENDNLVFTEWMGEGYIDRGTLEWNKLNDILYKNWENAIIDKDGAFPIANSSILSGGLYNSQGDNSVAVWQDDGYFLSSFSNTRGIETANWTIDSSGVFSGTSNSAYMADAISNGAGTPVWYDDNVNLTAGSSRGISTLDWQIAQDGSFTGNAANASNATYLGNSWLDNGTDLSAFNEGDGMLSRGIATQKWSIDYDGIAALNYIRLYDGANGNYGDIITQDSRYVFYDAGQWSCFSFQGDNFRFGDGGNGGSWGANKPMGLSTEDNLYCYFPYVNDEVLVASIQGNFADQYGNIRKVLRSLTTSEINTLTGQDAEVSTMYYNTTLDCPVFKSAAGWRKFSHTAM
jgi:hypothetical protein